MTAWEQILMWSLTGVAIGLTILLGVCVLRQWLKMKIQGGGEGVAKATKKAIRDLKSRLIDIETDLRINETTVQPRTSTPIEEEEKEEERKEEEEENDE